MLRIVFTLLIFIVSCSASFEPGVVAIINGNKIYLEDLEKKYDFTHLEYADNFSTLNKIKDEYKKELLNLFFYELVKEELKNKNMLVTKEEVKKEEEKIRSDYPPGEFEKILVEEYIDIDSWRDFLRMKLTIDKFINIIVKPKIKIDIKELETYYKKNIEDFYIGEMVKFVSFYSLDKDKLINIKNKKISIEEVKKVYPGVIVKEYNLPLNQIPQFWLDLIKPTAEDSFSNIKNDKKGFYLLFIEKKESPRYLKPIEAYPIIERNIIQQKINNFLQDWFIHKLKESDIKISSVLIKEK